MSNSSTVNKKTKMAGVHKKEGELFQIKNRNAMQLVVHNAVQGRVWKVSAKTKSLIYKIKL